MYGRPARSPVCVPGSIPRGRARKAGDRRYPTENSLSRSATAPSEREPLKPPSLREVACDSATEGVVRFPTSLYRTLFRRREAASRGDPRGRPMFRGGTRRGTRTRPPDKRRVSLSALNDTITCPAFRCKMQRPFLPSCRGDPCGRPYTEL